MSSRTRFYSPYACSLLAIALLLPLQADAQSKFKLGLGVGGVSEKFWLGDESLDFVGARLSVSLNYALFDHVSIRKVPTEHDPTPGPGFWNPNSYSCNGDIRFCLVLPALVVIAVLSYGIFFGLAHILSYRVDVGIYASYDHQQALRKVNILPWREAEISGWGFGSRIFFSEHVPLYISGSFNSSQIKIDSDPRFNQRAFTKKGALGLMAYTGLGPYVEFEWERSYLDELSLGKIVKDSIESKLPNIRERRALVFGYSLGL